MKRNISNILMLFILFCGMTACEKEALPTAIAGINKSEELTFSFNARATATTENEIASEINLNEDKIETLDLFFFTETDKPYIVHRQYTNTNQDKNTTYTVNVSSEGLDMTGKTQYLVYAVVNRVIPKKEYTLADLKKLAAKEISVDNTTTDKDESIQTSFVMDGELSTTLSSSMTTPVIQLQRSVAKITLDINVAKEIFVGSNKIKYTPIPGTMTVKLVNGVKNGIINGLGTADYFETTTANPTTRSISEVADGNDCTPFYSYPYDWSTNKNNDCHLYLSIQWESGLGGINTYYYIVPIGEVTKLIRNNHYKINLDVAILGGTEEDPVTLNANYIIENWSTCEISTELKKYKYLWVKGTSFTMDNEDRLKIEYASSSEITLNLVSVQRKQKVHNNSAETDTNVTQGLVSLSKDNNNNIIVDVNRKDDEEDTGKDNYRPWVITFTVTADGITKEIIVEHRPAIYVIGNFNSNGSVNRFVNGYDGSEDKIYAGSVYLGSLNDISNVGNNDTNRNKNQYKIYISSFGKDYPNYYIGDPRGGENNLSNLGLSHYHPAKTDNSVDKVIAPSFLIASSWGITQPVKFNEGQYRCASYQENGYPAGRWRLPTLAEIEFIVELSDAGYIPALFQGNYWYSSGGSYRGGTGNADYIYTRCVYDLWFWGDQPALSGSAANEYSVMDNEYN